MNIELVPQTYIDSTGTMQTYTRQRSTVEVALGGVTRTVTVERLSDNHVWYATDAAVVVRFPTGSKEHVVGFSVVQRGSKWVVSVQGFRNRNTCTPVRWAEANEVGSGWGR